MGIAEDGTAGDPAGNLWIVTGNALSRLGQDRKTFRTYDSNDGLPSTPYTGAVYTTRDGKILIGSNDGLIAFDPAALRDNPNIPPVAFTDFLVNNKSVPIGPNSPLPQAINQVGTIQLSYTDRVISFEFSALSYRAPARNRYRYKLDGFDATWTDVDNMHRLVTYTNLDPGTYVFHVTASNGDGVWNDTGRTITMVITPPWWETLWFRAVVVLSAIAILLAAYSLRVSGLRRRARVLEVAVSERTADLSRSNAALESEIVERKSAEQALQEANVDLDRRVRELSGLNEIAQALTQWTDITMAVQRVGSTIARMFGCTAAGVWLVDDSHLKLTRVVAAAHDRTLTEVDQVELNDDPISARMLAEPRTKVICGSEAQPLIAQPPHLPADDRAGSCILSPLSSRGDVIGMLCIRATSPEHIFTPADTDLAQTVAGTLANAIENARLFTEARASAAEDERRRLARELHDSVSQALFAANLTAEVLPDLWAADPDHGREALTDLHRFTSSALVEMRTLLIELRPKAILDTPLHDLLLTLVDATSARSHAIVDEHINKAPPLPPDVKVAFYRLAQEGLNNIVKHADARHISITLQFTPPAPADGSQAAWSGKAEMQITDDGDGFDPVQAKQGRLGLDGMRERAATIGAGLSIVSTPGSGTQVSVSWTGSNAALKEAER